MKRQVFRCLVIMMVAAALTTLLDSAAWAHRLLIRPVEPGRVQVIYDDQKAAQQAEVIVYDQQQREIARGKVDEEGYFTFDPKLPAAALVANDGMGHRATWHPDEAPAREIPKLPVVILVVALLVFIAAFFQYRSSAKN